MTSISRKGFYTHVEVIEFLYKDMMAEKKNSLKMKVTKVLASWIEKDLSDPALALSFFVFAPCKKLESHQNLYLDLYFLINQHHWACSDK